MHQLKADAWKIQSFQIVATRIHNTHSYMWNKASVFLPKRYKNTYTQWAQYSNSCRIIIIACRFVFVKYFLALIFPADNECAGNSLHMQRKLRYKKNRNSPFRLSVQLLFINLYIMVTYSDLIQIGILIVGIIGLFVSIKKK